MSLFSRFIGWCQRIEQLVVTRYRRLCAATQLILITIPAISGIPWHRRLRSIALIILSIPLWLAVALLAPEQLTLVIYKASLVASAALMGYWIDRSVFPYSRPDGYLRKDWRHGTDEPEDDADFPVVSGYQKVFVMAMLRRAIVIAAVVIGVSVGL